VGFVNAALLKQHMWPPGEDVLVIMCGPAPMCRALKKTLAELGYTIGSGPNDMVYSFM
jgi:cytochrome-b5 reductase